MALSNSRVHKRQCPDSKHRTSHCTLLPCSRPQDMCKEGSQLWSSLSLHLPRSWRHSYLLTYRLSCPSWRCWLVWYRDGWYCAYAGIPNLNERVTTLRKLKQDAPDDSLGDLFPFLLGTFDEGREVSFRGVLHKEVEIILVAVKHSRDELDDMLVIETGKYPHLISGIIPLILTHAEATDLHHTNCTFLMATFSCVSRSLTRKTLPKAPRPKLF